VNKIDGILATLGVKGYRALRRDHREQLALLRQPGGARWPRKLLIALWRYAKDGVIPEGAKMKTA
jgi:hypothetical protein